MLLVFRDNSRSFLYLLRKSVWRHAAFFGVDHGAAPLDSWSCKTNEVTRDIARCSLYKQSHKPKKRLLFPLGGGEQDSLICLCFEDFGEVHYF